jgi:predicted CDP-diglyceride synthetase/phosphatidate cytidylyltransferase
MPPVDINIVAVIVATFAAVVIGAVWFNAPFAFNTLWLKGIGKTKEQVAAQASPVSIVAAILGGLLTALALSVFMDWMGVKTLVSGALVGLLCAVAFAPNLAIIKDLFEGRPRSLSLINAGQDVVILVVMGGIIGGMQ